MVITPSGIPYTRLGEEMLVLVDLETGAWSGRWKPSGERGVHREIYMRRPDVGAVVHSHQNAASVFAAARSAVRMPWGDCLCASYALPGTRELTRATVRALGEAPAVLMANHGAFTVGSDLGQAFERIRDLEKACADFMEDKAKGSLPTRLDAPWDPTWLRSLHLADGSEACLSAAPFTLAWARRNRSMLPVLDDLAQLAGTRVRRVANLPLTRPRAQAVFVQGQGALLLGEESEALALVLEKAARAAMAGELLGGAMPIPTWEAALMRYVYRHSYAKQAAV